MTKLNLTRDINGFNTYSIPPADVMKSAFLTQNNPENFTVPTEFKFYQLNFSIDPGLRVWVSYDGNAAASPTLSFFSNTNSELNPTSRTVPGGATIYCVTPDTSAQVGVTMYGIP